MDAAPYNEEHIAGFIRSFIAPSIRERLLGKWLHRKWHDQSLDELNHFDTDRFRHAAALPSPPDAAFARLAREFGDRSLYVISANRDFDNRFIAWPEALVRLSHEFEGFILSVVPGRVALYRSENMNKLTVCLELRRDA